MAHRKIVSVTEVTVFCAVWHQDPRRHALLKAHRENLRRQSRPVEVVYVFDGGDVAPEGLEAQTIAANGPLTIYQAWNLALAAVRTPLVMNLNLDDRLAPDAVEKLAADLKAQDAVLAGGDWRICYSQEETDAVSPCLPGRRFLFPSNVRRRSNRRAGWAAAQASVSPLDRPSCGKWRFIPRSRVIPGGSKTER